MTRGSTPRIIMELPDSMPVSCISAAVLSIGQGGTEVIKKVLADMTVSAEDNTVSAVLTQADTMLLSDNSNAQIQLKCKINDDVTVSEIETVDVSMLLNNDIL